MPHTNSLTTTQLPRQRIPRDEKDEEWKEDTLDAIIDLSDFQVPHDDQTRDIMWKAYQYYNGTLVDEDYTHVTRPYGKKRENFPANLHNYPIIKPIIDLLIGEKARRPLDYTVKVNNDDVSNRKMEAKRQRLKQNLMGHFLLELKQQGLPVDELAPDQMPQPPEEVAEIFERDYRDQRSIMGQKAVDYLVDRLNLDKEFERGFKHWLISGRVVSLREVRNGDVNYEILNPLDVDYEKSPGTEYIEDGQWAVHRRLSTVNDVIDAFYEDLSEEDIDQLESEPRDESSFILWAQDQRNQEDNKGRLVEVMEVYWKSMKKIGFVTYEDELGMLQEKRVEEGYETREEDVDIEWHWITEVWRGYRIDGDIYVHVEPMHMQRRDLDNPSEAKLPINGRAYSEMNAPGISLVMLGIPYQISYNIYKYRLENAIAKAKGVIAQLDINMIPDNWDMDKFMYYVDATGIAWTDYGDQELSPQHQTVLDMTAKVIGDYTELLQSIQMEWERLSGVTRQRMGQISQYDTKGGSEQAIVQSSYVTEDYHNKFNHFEEKELNALLDYSRITWIDGKSMSYVLPDGGTQILQIDGIQHMESEYGVRVSNAREDMENMEQLKELTQAMLQNGVPLSTVIDVMEANSLANIKEKAREADKKMREMEQQQIKAQQQEAQAEMRMTQMDNEADLEEARLKSEVDWAIAQLKEGVERDKIQVERLENELERQNDLRITKMQNQESNSSEG